MAFPRGWSSLVVACLMSSAPSWALRTLSTACLSLGILFHVCVSDPQWVSPPWLGFMEALHPPPPRREAAFDLSPRVLALMPAPRDLLKVCPLLLLQAGPSAGASPLPSSVSQKGSLCKGDALLSVGQTVSEFREMSFQPPGLETSPP